MRIVRSLPAVALAAATLAVPGVAAARPGEHARDFTAPVTLGARAAAAGPLTTPPRRAPRPFDLLGFRWRAPAHVTIHVRTRRPDGSFGRWVLAGDGAAHGAPRASDPVWTGRARVYQVRLSRPVAGLRAHFVEVPRVRVPAATASAVRAAGAPHIIPRSAWDPGHDCDPVHSPSYGRVDMGFVHHTVNANTYGPDDSAAIVLAMCRYHERSNGWWDIGYNFVVDRYGQVFEGRAGGVTRAVVGAQAQGYNSVSTGVASIGTFDKVGQTAAGLRALGRLLGWKLTISGVPAKGLLTEVSAGGPLNRYANGTRVHFRRISGHRDGDSTACPGDALYDQLPRIRDLAAAAADAYRSRPILTISAGSTLAAYGSAVTFSGRLALPHGADPAGTTIELQRHGDGGWADVGTGTASDAGSWAVTARAHANARYRARWAGGGDFPAAASPSFGLLVAPRLRLAARDVHVPVNHRAVVAGTVRPGKAAVVVRAFRRLRGGRYTYAARWTVSATDGAWSLKPVLHDVTLYRFVARTKADASNAAGASAPLYVRAVKAGAAAGGGGPGGGASPG